MSPRSILTLLATLAAVATLCLAGAEVAMAVNQGATFYHILFAASAVLTSVVCIGVLDWARNLNASQSREPARGMDNAEDGARSLGYAPGADAENRLLDAVHRLQGLGNDELSGEKALQEALDLIGEYTHATSVSVWSVDGTDAPTPMGERTNGRTLVGADAVTEPLDETVAEELLRHRKPMETVGELTTTFLLPLSRGSRCTGILKVVVET
ncbi:hypothetical protein HQ560_04065, partial [bacterium]|nr:hypothetical protein [bacterium]